MTANTYAVIGPLYIPPCEVCQPDDAEDPAGILEYHEPGSDWFAYLCPACARDWDPEYLRELNDPFR